MAYNHSKWVEEIFNVTRDWEIALSFVEECVTKALIAEKRGLIIEHSKLFWCSFVQNFDCIYQSQRRLKRKVDDEITSSMESLVIDGNDGLSTSKRTEFGSIVSVNFASKTNDTNAKGDMHYRLRKKKCNH